MLHASLLIPLLLAATTAEKKGEDTLLRMACHLCDGSLVIGDVDPATKLKLATGTGKLNIPLRRIVRIAVADDRETMQIFLPNGNPVTGFAEIDGFSLKTASGRTVFVRLPTVRECTLRVGDKSVLVAKVDASGSWLNMKPANAIDKNTSTGWNAGAWNGWIDVDLGRVQVVSRVQFTVAHVPAGRSTWNVYLSHKPIRTQRGVARLIKQVAGNFREGSKIEVAFPAGAKGRYLQVQCPRSVSWVMIYEIDVFAAKTEKKVRKPVKTQPAELTAKDNPNASQAAAVAAITRLGGRVTFDTKSPDRPAITLRLDRPHFIDEYLVHLKGLTSLQTLHLTNSRVTDAGLEHVKGLMKLQTLYLTNTQITDEGLKHLKGLKSLKTLYLADTPVTDAGFAHLKALPKLQTLYLTNTKVTGAGLEHLKEMTSLQALHLTNTRVTDAALEHLKEVTSLRGLHFHGTKVTDAGLAHLKALTSLETLILDDTQVTDAGLVHLKGLTSLQVLHLHGTQVTDAGLEHLKGLTKLERLVLNRTKVTDVGLVHLKGLASLKTLYLTYNTKITDAGLVHVEGMTNLKTLSLAYTEVTDFGLEHLYALPKLQTLYLSNSKVTGAGVKALRTALPNCNVGS